MKLQILQATPPKKKQTNERQTTTAHQPQTHSTVIKRQLKLKPKAKNQGRRSTTTMIIKNKHDNSSPDLQRYEKEPIWGISRIRHILGATSYMVNFTNENKLNFFMKAHKNKFIGVKAHHQWDNKDKDEKEEGNNKGKQEEIESGKEKLLVPKIKVK